MAKKGGLKAALEQYKGVDHALEKQKRLQKQAAKRKRNSSQSEVDKITVAETIADEEEIQSAQKLISNSSRIREERSANRAQAKEKVKGQADGWETDEEDDEDGGIEIGQLEDESDSDSDENMDLSRNGTANEDEEEDEDIPLSDIESLASEDKGDIIPHQKLTINNTAALLRSLKSFALPSSLPFSANQSITSTEPIEIPDIDDDLNRELALYKQSLDAVKEARNKLKKEGVPFTRPTDYFAEMVKSEEQMGKVKQKLVDEAARKKASSDARRQRDLKKFGKAVQVAKLQERDRAKRDTMDKINALKRKRQGAELNATEDDRFDVALEDAAETAKADKADRRARHGEGPNTKRQRKDEKFGFGGKKKHSKSNDARSTSDMRGFSTAKMKGKGGKQRPGKSRRAKMG